MRPLRPVLGIILVGCAVVVVGARKSLDVSLTTLALFLAAAIVTELVEESDRERSREPIEQEPFRLGSAVLVAAVLLLGPWSAAVVAVAGAVAGAALRAAPLRTGLFRASAFACAAAAAGVAFHVAGGHVGRLELPNSLIPLVALGIAFATVRTLLLDVVFRRETFEPRLVASAGEVALGAAVALLAILHPWNVVVVVPVAVALHQMQLRLTKIQRETLRALETFANIVDERDPSTYRHSIRVAGYVDQLARALQLPFSDIDRLRWAGRLHDLGKVAVDSNVLRKPDRLDRDEWASVRRHPRLSARLLQRFTFVATQARAVELHHERFDGRGYYGIADENLPLAAHFLIVADSFDAMTTDRPYRRRLSKDEALAEIMRNMGTQFHPEVAAAFVAVQWGVPLEDVFSPEQLAAFRNAVVPYRLSTIPHVGNRKDRPDLLVLGGVLVALLGVGFHDVAIAVFGGAGAVVGLLLRAAARIRAERVAGALRAALQGPGRASVFDDLVAALRRRWPVPYAALVQWQEDGLGGRIVRVDGTGPAETEVLSWLVREADSGASLLVAPAAQLGRDGIVLAVPLRRETSALAGFVVLESPRLPPGHVELALLETLDELGLALAGRPESGGSRGENAEALEAVADASELVVGRLHER